MSSLTSLPPSSSETVSLIERVLKEMAAAWQGGERAPAEDYLNRYPNLRDDPEAAVRLVYEEFCLRQECGQEIASEELTRRFPQWAAELSVLLDCHRLMKARVTQPIFPQPGNALGSFHLVKELGRGREGRVFLATQPALADRPVVLKVTPRRVREHLALARLQHTHIIPLHGLVDFPQRNFCALCMPFLGGATLAHVLELMRAQPPERRTGQALVDALRVAEQDVPIRLAGRGAYFEAYQKMSYVEAICCIGACLADGLHYAHERDLVHLDLKPSNVLLDADGQPLLLDFHLAREPIRPHEEMPDTLGGTPGYMSPEQRAAFGAIQHGRGPEHAVDARSDIYSLGIVLYEALSGRSPVPGGRPGSTLTVRLGKRPPSVRDAARPEERVASSGYLWPLHSLNPQVRVGLSDVIGKCLAPGAGDRYADAAALAADLRRHLAHLPLQGVPNRSLPERWQKWRRRRPNAPLWAALLLALTAAAALLAVGAIGHYSDVQAKGHAALGESLLHAGQVERASEELAVALDLRPRDFSSHFYRGMCAYRRRQYADAVDSFGAAIALAPACAECYYNRALAYTAWGKNGAALADYNRALALQPSLGVAALNRAVLHYQDDRFLEAEIDLEQALRHGANPAAVHYDLALVHFALRHPAAGQWHLEKALKHNPEHSVARALQQRLRHAR